MLETASQLKVLIDENRLQARIAELADEINEYYGTVEELTIVCILKGAIMFFTQLASHLKMPVRMEFVQLSSYGSAQKSSGEVSQISLKLPPLEGKNVLLVEDIIDTGLTLKFLKDFINSKCLAKNVRIAAMFDKSCARKHEVNPDFYAFDVDDKFIVGFGLDYNELYRNLPYIGYFEVK